MNKQHSHPTETGVKCLNDSPERTFFGVEPVSKPRTLDRVEFADLFADTGKEIKVSLAAVTDPEFETGDRAAKCSDCGEPAEFVTYYEEQSRFEAARIVKDGCWEILRSEVKVNGEMSDITYFCEKCFNS